MENQWNLNGFQNYAPPLVIQNLESVQTSKRARQDSESSEEGESPATPKNVAPNFVMNPVNHMVQYQQNQWVEQYRMHQQPSGFAMAHPHQITYNMMMPQENPPQTNTSSSSSEEDSGIHSASLNLPDNEILFTTVPGRLALLSQNKKVEVTLAEVQRRINAPECLNQSLLSAILRKAKNKEGGAQLQNELSKYNIQLASGRRKSAPNTAFTALVESESLILARDFAELSDKHFPFNDIAYEFLKTITTIEEWHSSTMVIHNYVSPSFGVLQRLIAILSMDKSPIVNYPLQVPSLMHPDSQKNFTNYSLITHGFGVPCLHSGWNTQFKVFKVLYEAMVNPRQFCTKLARPIPDAIALLEPVILMTQQQQQQNHATLLQHSSAAAYPSQMMQQQQQQPQHQTPKANNHDNTYIQ